MWCLKGREGFCVYILPNQRKSFGKLSSDIKLEDDATVSRLHAVVSVEPREESETQYNGVIKDVSKYGTFVTRDKKKTKLPVNDKFALKAGDIVQFGLKESTFVVLYYSFIIAWSSLNKEDMKKLKDIVYHLKVRLSETWENFCTHLTVAKSTLFTSKLACALASAKPIVTIAYWEAVDIAIKESKELPKIEDFLPRVKEEWLKVCSRLFLPNEKRKTLFKGLSFVHFCTKQYFAYAPLITAADGKSCVYPTKRPLTPRDLTAKNAIVIQQLTNDSSQLTQTIVADYPIIYHKLQAVKRRMVSDTEIPLAILYCTTDMYCNPKYDFVTFFKSKTPTFHSTDMIIENTQDIVNTDTKQIKRKIIPETCESLNDENVLKKIRCFDETEKKKKHISAGVDKNDIITTRDRDNGESKHTIIPETCDSQINNKILRSSYLIYENERKYMPSTSESNVAIGNSRDADNKEIRRKRTAKTCDSQNTDNSSKKTLSFNESDQRYVSDTSRRNIAAKSQNRNIMKDINFSNESEQKNISDSNERNITRESTEKHVVNNFGTEMERQIVELRKEETFEENNMIFAENNQEKSTLRENEYIFQQRENMIIKEENGTIFEENNLSGQENSIVEKDNLNTNNGKVAIARWDDSKNAKISQAVAIKEIKDKEIYIKQGKENNLSGKGCSRVESQASSKQGNVTSVCTSEKNRDKRVKEDKIQTKDNKKKEARKTADNWYEKFLNQESTDEVLRKDIPCGKKFIKMSIMKPERILRVDDFVL